MSRKLNIAIDIDDTLTNTSDYLQPFIAEYFGVALSEVQEKQIAYENLPEPWKKDTVAFMKTYADRVVPDTPFKPDAAWGVNELRERGHRIIIITARTTAFYTDPYATTTEELRRGGIVYDKLICSADKATVCREEQIDVLIDDHPRNCETVAAVGVSIVNMFSWPYQDVQMPYPRVHNWTEAVAAVDKISRKSMHGEQNK